MGIEGGNYGHELGLDWGLDDGYVVHSHCCLPDEAMLKHKTINCVRHPKNVLLSGARWAISSKQATGSIEAILIDLIRHGTYLNLQPSWLDRMALYAAGWRMTLDSLPATYDGILFKRFEDIVDAPPGLPVRWVEGMSQSGRSVSWPPPWDQITSAAVMPKHGIAATHSAAFSDWRESRHWTPSVEKAYREAGGPDVERLLGYV
jgi:hypothetical protein